MNQILQVQENRNKNRSNPIDTKKIVLFFGACLIIFGLIMLGQGAYSAYQNHINRPVEPPKDSGGDAVEYTPIIVMTQTEDNKLKINVDSQIAISHIIYNWNNDAAVTLDQLGKTSIEEIIDIPIGENIIKLSVIDLNGKETKQEGNFVIDQTKPVIEIFKSGNDIRIKVTSKVELSYITYKWNNEAEKREQMLTYEDKKNFEKKIEIPKGQNTLKVVAVDINNNTSENSKVLEGVPQAITKAKVKGEYLHFSVTSEVYNVESVEFEFNGKKYLMNATTFGKTKEVNYKLKLINGWNYLKITTKLEKDNFDSTKTTYWKYEFKQQ